MKLEWNNDNWHKFSYCDKYEKKIYFFKDEYDKELKVQNYKPIFIAYYKQKCSICTKKAIWCIADEYYCHDCTYRNFYDVMDVDLLDLVYEGHLAIEKLEKYKKLAKNANCKICKNEKDSLKKLLSNQTAKNLIKSKKIAELKKIEKQFKKLKTAHENLVKDLIPSSDFKLFI